MKKYVKNISLTLLISILALNLTGCDFSGTAYKVLSITAQSVDTAMTAYANDIYPRGVDPVTHEKVRKTYEAYQSAALVATAAVRTYDHAVELKASKADLAKAKEAAIGALRELQKVYTNLVDLLDKLGVKEAKFLNELEQENGKYKVY